MARAGHSPWLLYKVLQLTAATYLPFQPGKSLVSCAPSISSPTKPFSFPGKLGRGTPLL